MKKKLKAIQSFFLRRKIGKVEVGIRNLYRALAWSVLAGNPEWVARAEKRINFLESRKFILQKQLDALSGS